MILTIVLVNVTSITASFHQLKQSKRTVASHLYYFPIYCTFNGLTQQASMEDEESVLSCKTVHQFTICFGVDQM